jgi:hypothetical protein
MMGAGYLGKKRMSRDRWTPYNRPAVWTEKFAFLPQRCELSNKRLWFKRCMVSTVSWLNPGYTTREYIWRDMKEHTLWLLKH